MLNIIGIWLGDFSGGTGSSAAPTVDTTPVFPIAYQYSFSATQANRNDRTLVHTTSTNALYKIYLQENFI